jgi:hypothetical protein
MDARASMSSKAKARLRGCLAWLVAVALVCAPLHAIAHVSPSTAVSTEMSALPTHDGGAHQDALPQSDTDCLCQHLSSLPAVLGDAVVARPRIATMPRMEPAPGPLSVAPPYRPPKT